MKFFETKYEDYLISSKKINLHPENDNFINKVKEIYNLENNNLILYGPCGVGKYTQSLNIIEKFSASNLKYERKINIPTLKNKIYTIRISDIHFEIDMELLGCNAKILWNDIFKSIIDIISTRQFKKGIILCKNFNKIHNELLEIFYSYMQSLEYNNIHVSYILLTESVSFIPETIVNKCFILPIKRPTKTNLKKCFTKVNFKDVSNIRNLKSMHINNNDVYNYNKQITKNISEHILNKNISSLTFRNELYDIFIYHLDLYEYIWDIIKNFIELKKIDEDKLTNIVIFVYKFLKYYNNNYRPIYHLERLIIYLTSVIHEI
tara:strand:- start:3522 stop:4481 length:960 start_codon:yes stop_codon:yes gene_type:complete